MKKSTFRPALLVALALPQMASATLLVGFHSYSNPGGSGVDTTPNDSLSGFSGSISSTVGAGAIYGSADGYYGPDSTFDGGVATSNPSQNDGRIAIANGTSLSVTNGTSENYSLRSILFDLGSTATTGLTDVTYQIFNGLTTIGSGALVSTGKVKGANTGNPLATISSGFNVTYPPGTVNTQNFSDFIGDLTGITLGGGQKIVFTWITSGAVARIDNIAITAVPEPASLLTIGCVLGSGLMLRNRRRPTLTVA